MLEHELIEKVAHVLFSTDTLNKDDEEQLTFESVADWERENYRKMAKAAIGFIKYLGYMKKVV